MNGALRVRSTDSTCKLATPYPFPWDTLVAAKFRTEALKEQKRKVLHPIDSDLMLENAVYRLRASARNKKSADPGPTLFDVSI